MHTGEHSPTYPLANGDHTDDVRTELTENDDGFCTLQVRAKRGEGTRDQDRVTATLGRPSLEEVEEERDDFLDMIEDTVGRTREMRLSEDDGSEGEGQ
jgi:hypothetical protein